MKVVESEVVNVVDEFSEAVVDWSLRLVVLKGRASVGDVAGTELVESPTIKVDSKVSMAPVETGSGTVVAPLVVAMSFAVVTKGSIASVDSISRATVVEVCVVLVDISSIVIVERGCVTLVHNAPITVDVSDALVVIVDTDSSSAVVNDSVVVVADSTQKRQT